MIDEPDPDVLLHAMGRGMGNDGIERTEQLELVDLVAALDRRLRRDGGGLHQDGVDRDMAADRSGSAGHIDPGATRSFPSCGPT